MPREESDRGVRRGSAGKGAIWRGLKDIREPAKQRGLVAAEGVPGRGTGPSKAQKQREHARRVRKPNGGGMAGSQVSSVAGEWAEGQTAQALVAPGLGP